MPDKFLKLFRSEDPSERREAVEGLRGGPENVAIPFLVTALMDQNPGVQQAAIDILVDIASPAVVSSVIPLLRDELSAPLRNMAVEILSRTGAHDVESIARLLREENTDVRRFAADILGVIGDKRSTSPLITALKDENPNVRSSAANSLGMIGDRAAITPLIESLETEKDEWVIFSEIEALGKVGDEAIIGPLTQFLEGGSEPLMLASIEALKGFRVPAVANTLVNLLDAANEEVRGEVLKILVDMLEICSDCFPERGMLDKLTGHLLSALVDGDEEVKYAAVKGVGLIRERRAVKILISILRDLDSGIPEDEEKVICIYNALKEIGDEEGLLLGVSTYGTDTPVPVIDILGELKSGKAAGYLIDIFEGADRERKRAVVAAVGRIGNVNSVDFLAEALEDESGYVRKEAADALANMGSKKALPCLFMRLEREHYDDVREVLLSAIVKIGKSGAYNGLVTLINSSNPETREMGARGLGMLSDERAVLMLIKSVNDESANVRKASVGALSSFKKPEVKEALKVALMDGEPGVRVAAVQAVAGIGGNGAVAELSPLLSDPEPWVRSQTIEVLGEIGGKGMVKVVIAALDDPNPIVRVSAIRSLGKLKVKSSATALKEFLARTDDGELMDEVERALERIEG